MSYPNQIYCQLCEYLRVDNFCLAKNKYIKSPDTLKKRNCKSFSPKELEDVFWQYYLDQTRHQKKSEALTITIKNEKD